MKNDIIKIILQNSPNLPPETVLDKLKFVSQQIKEQHGSFTIDSNWDTRSGVIKELYHHFTDQEKLTIRWLLKEEITFGQETGHSSQPLKVCAFMLYKMMSIEDVPLLYDAKFNCNMDASIEMDIELVFGMDKEKTKQYYIENPDKEREIVRKIERYESLPYKPRDMYIKYFEKYRIPYLLEDEIW